ncbi:MAG: DUF4124 domain-containing protein [Woeseia sp.]
MYKRTLLVSALLLFAAAASAQVYKWVDADGVIHYSDQPVPGAELVTLPKRSTSNPVTAPRQRPAASRPAANAPADTATKAPETIGYSALSFTAPIAEETLWNIGGVLSVSLALQPALQPGHRLRLYFDGEPREVSTLNVQLEEVWRGEHNLQAEVLDETGKTLIRSQPMRFYVQQTTINRP